jgi:ribosomal protein S18 acetylase RimI-like enzyme
MNPPHIRQGTYRDIEIVRDLERRSTVRFEGTDFAHHIGEDPTDAEHLIQRATDGGFLVAVEADRPVAYVIFREVEGCGYIEQIDVDPDYAGRRLGAALLDAVADIGRRRGWPALTLSTYRDIPWNAPWYRRLGFVDWEGDALDEGHRAIRERHIANGLAEDRRTFMRRSIEKI